MIPRSYIGVGDVTCDPATYAGCTPAQIQSIITASPTYRIAIQAEKDGTVGGCPPGYSLNTSFPGGLCVDSSGRPIGLTDAETLALIQAARATDTPFSIATPSAPSIPASVLWIGGAALFGVLLLAMAGGRR